MKRRRLLITGVLLLLGGAIVNVAVAWGAYTLFWQSETADHQRPDSETSLRIWSRMRPFDEHRFNGIAETVSAESNIGHKRLQTRIADDPYSTIVEFQTGLPKRSLAFQLWDDETTSLHWCIKSRWLPCYPLWPGFAINTIFYAAMLWGGWVVFFVPGMVRRRIRRRRGLCPACAYPIGTSPVCTECGAALPSPSGRGQGEGALESQHVAGHALTPDLSPEGRGE